MVNKCKHSSLTHFMRRHHSPQYVAYALSHCDVSPYIGGLPPQLCSLVARDSRAHATRQFCSCITDIWNKYGVHINNGMADMVFDLADVSHLFGTKCQLFMRATNAMGYSPWGGAFGIVCKMSFPEIRAEYALKFFYKTEKNLLMHGAEYEIPTAFAANYAEPRDNCRIYMASLGAECPFMLSQWGGDVNDGRIRENKYKIFTMSEEEAASNNYRNMRRIDFGETYLTDYGAASYRVRKLYRQFENALQQTDKTTFVNLFNKNNQKPQSRYEMFRAMEILANCAFYDNNYELYEFLNVYKKRLQNSH